MRAGIVVNVTRADRHRLEAIVSDRSAPQKYVWRANIILATAAGRGGEPALGATYPRGPPTRAASHPHVQAVERPEVRRETQRRRRPLRRPPRPRGRPLGRREEISHGEWIATDALAE